MDINLQVQQARSNETESARPITTRPVVTRNKSSRSESVRTVATRTISPAPGLSNSLLATIADSHGRSTTDFVSDRTLENVISQVNETLQNIDRRIEHSVHEETNTILVRVVNSYTGEVIRELPDESRLDVLVSIKEALGINVNTSV